MRVTNERNNMKKSEDLAKLRRKVKVNFFTNNTVVSFIMASSCITHYTLTFLLNMANSWLWLMKHIRKWEGDTVTMVMIL